MTEQRAVHGASSEASPGTKLPGNAGYPVFPDLENETDKSEERRTKCYLPRASRVGAPILLRVTDAQYIAIITPSLSIFRNMEFLVILSVIAAAGPSLMVLICHFHQLVAECFAVFYSKRPDYCRPERLESVEHR